MRTMYGSGRRVFGHRLRSRNRDGRGVERPGASAGRGSRAHVRQRVVHRGRAGRGGARGAAGLRRAVQEVRALAVGGPRAAHRRTLQARTSRQPVHGQSAQVLQRRHQGGAVHEVRTIIVANIYLDVLTTFLNCKWND